MLTHVITISSMSLGKHLGSTTKELWNNAGTIEVSVDWRDFTFTCSIRLNNSLQISSLINFLLYTNVSPPILLFMSELNDTGKMYASLQQQQVLSSETYSPSSPLQHFWRIIIQYKKFGLTPYSIPLPPCYCQYFKTTSSVKHSNSFRIYCCRESS